MKKHLITNVCILLFFSVNLTAQHRPPKHHKKIKAYKVAYITEKLDLTESEAQKFWPIYNIYSDGKMALHREERSSIRKRISESGGIQNLTNDEAKEILERIKDISKRKGELKTDFFNKMSGILSYKKLLTLEIAEHEFNRKLIRKLRPQRKKGI